MLATDDTELLIVCLGPREGEDTETGERGGGPGETKRLLSSPSGFLDDPRDGEDTEDLQEGDSGKS